MRTIKFRAWDKENKTMKDAPLGTISGYALGDKIHDRIELMQFTGLTDKNGKEIYEGDIIRHDTKDFHNGMLSIVKYKGSGFYGNGEMPIKALMKREPEVIGNIYENPDLLKD